MCFPSVPTYELRPSISIRGVMSHQFEIEFMIPDPWVCPFIGRTDGWSIGSSICFSLDSIIHLAVRRSVGRLVATFDLSLLYGFWELFLPNRTRQFSGLSGLVHEKNHYIIYPYASRWLSIPPPVHQHLLLLLLIHHQYNRGRIVAPTRTFLSSHYNRGSLSLLPYLANHAEYLVGRWKQI